MTTTEALCIALIYIDLLERPQAPTLAPRLLLAREGTGKSALLEVLS